MIGPLSVLVAAAGSPPVAFDRLVRPGAVPGDGLPVPSDEADRAAVVVPPRDVADACRADLRFVVGSAKVAPAVAAGPRADAESPMAAGPAVGAAGSPGTNPRGPASASPSGWPRPARAAMAFSRQNAS